MGRAGREKYILRKYKFRCSTSIHEYGYFITKYAELTLEAIKAKERGSKLSKGEQKEILSRKDLIVEVYTVGDRIDFAKDYSSYKKIRPKEKITVILIRSRWEEEKELRFEVDLSRYE